MAARHAGFLLVLAGSALIRLASIYGGIGDYEPSLWLALSLAAAFTFVRTRPHPVRYAFPATALGALASPLLHALLFPDFLARHPEVAAQVAAAPGRLPPRLFVLALGPVVAVAYGGVTTLITLVVSRMSRRAAGAE